ncbi:MAG TPA: flagellar motor switch protein FliG [Burkholderiales bacterium]|nr:flagellar motor switch protein FliG [Burkholderiales bacterium]
MTEDGLNRAAILLLSLGEQEAAEVFKFLGPKEVQKLGAAMAKLKNVKREKIEEVLEAFHADTNVQTSLGMDSNEYIRSVLTRALGEERATHLIDRILQGGDTSGIEGLKWMEAGMVAELIRNEHPQIIATILVHLERDQAAEILGYFSERLRADVMLRVATLDGVQPTALLELNEVLGKVMQGNGNLKKSALGGVRAAAEILNYLGGSLDTAIIESVKEQDADLAQQIVDEMFVFENIIDIDDRGVQLLLREIQSESLVVALKGTSAELREKIFKNMSQRAADMLRDDLEAKGPVRVSEVEAEQKEILKTVRRLVEEGQIALAGKGEESFV